MRVHPRIRSSHHFAFYVWASCSPVLCGPWPTQKPRHLIVPDERAAHNSVYLELGGTGLLWSANYDRMLGENFSLRAGVEVLSIYSFCDCNSIFFGIPIAASALIFPGAHKLELGLGATTFIGTTDNSRFTPAPIIWATGILGYRYAPKHRGLMFRATFTPLLAAGYIGSRGLGAPRPFFFPWGGLSVGYQF